MKKLTVKTLLLLIIPLFLASSSYGSENSIWVEAVGEAYVKIKNI